MYRIILFAKFNYILIRISIKSLVHFRKGSCLEKLWNFKSTFNSNLNPFFDFDGLVPVYSFMRNCSVFIYTFIRSFYSFDFIRKWGFFRNKSY